MPFADAQYPRPHSQLEYGGWPCHIVTLTNGQRLFLREGGGALEIALCERKFDEPDYWVCSITASGVLTFGNSGYACEALSGRPANA